MLNKAPSQEAYLGYLFDFLKYMTVCCVSSLESPYRGDSNEYTQYTILNTRQKSPEIIPNLQLCDFSLVLKNEFETAEVNEPSMLEPLKFYCIIFGQNFKNNPRSLDPSFKTPFQTNPKNLDPSYRTFPSRIIPKIQIRLVRRI